MMRRGGLVGDVDIDVSFLSVPKIGGHERKAFWAELHAVIQGNEIGAVEAGGFHHFDERGFFFWPQIAADEVEFVQSPIVIAAEVHHHVVTGFFGFGSIAKAIGSAPVAEAGVHFFCCLIDAVEATRKLLTEARRLLKDAGEIFSIDEAGIEGIDVEDHAILIAEPLKEGEVGEGLSLGGAFIGVVDPGKILGETRS